MQRPLLSQRDDCAYSCDSQPTTPALSSWHVSREMLVGM